MDHRLDAMSDSDCSESSESNANSSSSESSDSIHSEHPEVATETARILKHNLELPKGLCEDASIFQEFFSLNTLHQLGPQIQSHLQQFLPHFSDDPQEDALEKQRSLLGLFGGELDLFGSTPLADLQRNLEDGNYRPDIARFRANIQKSQRRENRFQECERISRVAKSMMASREKLLKYAYDSPAGTGFKAYKHRAVNGVTAAPTLQSSVATQRSKKRYFNEIASIAAESGLRDEVLTDDESYPGEPSFQMTRKQRRQLNGMQGGAMSPGSESRVQSTTAPRGGCLDHLVDAGGSFVLSADFYKQSIYQHKKRKMDEPDHPELTTKDVELLDILGRTHLTASDRRALSQSKPAVKKSKIKWETPPTQPPLDAFVRPSEPAPVQSDPYMTHPPDMGPVVSSVVASPAATNETYPEETSPISLPPAPTSPAMSDIHSTLPMTVFQNSSPISTSFHQKLPPPTTSIQQELFADQSNDFRSESENEDESPIESEPISPPPTPVRVLPSSPDPQKLFNALRAQSALTPPSKLIISVTGNGQTPSTQSTSLVNSPIQYSTVQLNPPIQSPSTVMLAPTSHQSIKLIESVPSPITCTDEVYTFASGPEPTTVFHITSEPPTVSAHHTQIHLPQYGGTVKAATLSDLEGIDMMHLPVDLDDSGNIGILNEMTQDDVSLESDTNDTEPKPELKQNSHSSFFSLIRQIFCSTPNHRTTTEHLHERIAGWLANPITALNDWYIEADNWLTQIDSALQFLVGDFPELPEDYVPYIEYKSQLSIYQWIGAGRDGDQHLAPLCEFWLQRRNEVTGMPIANDAPNTGKPGSKKTDGDDSGCGSTLDRPSSPFPPRYPTSWKVVKATEAEMEDFRAQERTRFEHPHLAFTYRQHGYESVVGPVKGIYTQIPVLSKARGHTMLTVDRPNFVTILTLVRDATARLPNGEGTRTDICELLRSSQYINPDAVDSVLQTIVSGALDRMHTEHDPCVRYDPKQKIWVYLHRSRSEEEFEKMHHQFQGVSKHKKQASRKIKNKSSIKSPKVEKGVRTAASPVTPKGLVFQSISPTPSKLVSTSPSPSLPSMPSLSTVSVSVVNSPITTITSSTAAETAPNFVPFMMVPNVPPTVQTQQPVQIQQQITLQQPVQVQQVNTQPLVHVQQPINVQQPLPIQQAVQVQQPVQHTVQPAQIQSTIQLQPVPIQSANIPPVQIQTAPVQSPLVLKPKILPHSDSVNHNILVSSSQPVAIPKPITQLPALSSIQSIAQTPPVFNKLAASKKSLVKADLIPTKAPNTMHKFEKPEQIDIEATLDAHNPPIMVNKSKVIQVQTPTLVPPQQTVQKVINFNVDTKPTPAKKMAKLIMTNTPIITTSSINVQPSTVSTTPSIPQMQVIHQNATPTTSTIRMIQSPNDVNMIKPTLNVTLAKQSEANALSTASNIVLGNATPKSTLIKTAAIIQQQPTTHSIPPQPQQQSILIQNQNHRSQSPMFVTSNVVATTTKKIVKPPPLVQSQLQQHQQQRPQQQPHQNNIISGSNFMIPINISTQSILQPSKVTAVTSTQSQHNHTTTQQPKPTMQRAITVQSGNSGLSKGVSLLHQINQKPLVRTTSVPPGKSLINPSVVAANITIQQQQLQKSQNLIPANVVSIQGRSGTTQQSSVNTQKITPTAATRTQQSTLTTAQQRQILQNIIAQQKQQRLNANNAINLIPGSVIVSSAQQPQLVQSKPILVSQPNASGFVQRIIVSSAATPTSIIFTTSTAVPASAIMTLASSGQSTKSSTTASTSSGTNLVNRQIIQIQQNQQSHPQSTAGSTINKIQTVSTANMTPQQQQNLLQSIKQQQIRVLNQQATATPQQQTLIVKQQQVLQQIQKQLQQQNSSNIKPGTSLLNHTSGTIISSLSTTNTTTSTTSGTPSMTRIIRPGLIRQHQAVQSVQSVSSRPMTPVQSSVASSPVMAKVQNTTGQIISLESLLQKQGQSIGSGTTLRVAGSKTGQASIIQLSGASSTAATQYAVVSQGLHGRSMISLTSAPPRLVTNASSSASSTIGTTLLKPVVDATRTSNDAIQPQLLQHQPPKLVQHSVTSTSGQLINPKMIGFQSVGSATRIKPTTTGIRMMNSSNLNIAQIAGKPVVISNKPNGPQMLQQHKTHPHQITQQNVIWQNVSSSSNTASQASNNSTTGTNFLIGGQTVKVHGNLLQNLDHHQATGSTRQPATSSPAVMFGNQVVKLQSSTISQSTAKQQLPAGVGQQQQVISNLGNAATTFIGQGGTTRTVVLGQTGQTIRVHSPAQLQASSTSSGQHQQQSTTIVGPNIKNTIKGGQLTSVAGQQRVVLAVQGGGQILLPPGFQGGPINIKGLKVIPMVQQKDSSNTDRPIITQIISAPKGPRPSNPNASDS